jgi:predicted metal-dependent hydrolase
VPEIRIRNVRIPFAEVPRHWFAGHPSATHLANALNMLFPAGERFFIRSVSHYLDRFKDDPEMQAQIRAFFGQEGSHAREHRRFFAVLESQGFEVSRFLSAYEWVSFGVIERLMPPVLRLATTAAAEHFTASLADDALRSDVFQQIHPEMRDLLLWHAAEEIEHKAVAYDVLQQVSSSYTVRAAGLAAATVLLVSWWMIAFAMFVRQDGMTLREALRALRESGLRGRHQPQQTVLRDAIKRYLEPDFHPWNDDNIELARQFLSTMATYSTAAA